MGDQLDAIDGREAVVVRAWAPWCGSCRALEPVVAAAASRSTARVVDVRVDLRPDLVDALRIRSVPTLVAIRDGVEVGRLVGAHGPADVDALFAAAVVGRRDLVPQRGTTTTLTVARVVTGVVLGGAGSLLVSVPLVVVGVALVGWAMPPILGRATNR